MHLSKSLLLPGSVAAFAAALWCASHRRGSELPGRTRTAACHRWRAAGRPLADRAGRRGGPAPASAPTRPRPPAPRTLAEAYPDIAALPADWRDFNRESDAITVAPYPDLPIRFRRTALKDEGRYVTWIGSNQGLPQSRLIAVAAPSGGYDSVVLLPGSGQFAFHTDPGGATFVRESRPGDEGCGVGVGTPDRERPALSPAGTLVDGVAPEDSVHPEYPVIVSQPEGGCLTDGQLALSVSVIGPGPLSYQWYLDGRPVPGATSNAYLATEPGQYWVFCANPHAGGYSAPALVGDPPSARTRVGVLVLYDSGTLAAAASVSADPAGYIDGISKAYVETGNVVLNDSGVDGFRWDYLGSVQAPAYARPCANLDGDLAAITGVSGGQIQGWVARQAYLHGADQVFLWSSDPDSTVSGIANSVPGQPAAPEAARAVGEWGTSYKTMIHELAHNFGCEHDRAHANVTSGDPNAAGVPPGNGLCCYGVLWSMDDPVIGGTVSAGTVMSYGGLVIPVFSNPELSADVDETLAGVMGGPDDWGMRTLGCPVSDPDAAFNAKVLSDNAAAMASFNAPVSGPPAITSQPRGATAAPGSSFSLEVAATGGGLAYQWYLGPKPIPGAAGPAYSAVATDATAGVYTVTVSNLDGSVTSSAATVALAAPVGAGHGGGGAPSLGFLAGLAVLGAAKRARGRGLLRCGLALGAAACGARAPASVSFSPSPPAGKVGDSVSLYACGDWDDGSFITGDDPGAPWDQMIEIYIVAQNQSGGPGGGIVAIDDQIVDYWGQPIWVGPAAFTYPSAGNWNFLVEYMAIGDDALGQTWGILASANAQAASPPDNVSFSASPTQFVYNGTAQGPAPNPTDTTNPSNSGSVSFAAGGTPQAVDAGTYAVRYDATGNFSGTSGNVSWTIAPAPQSIDFPDPGDQVVGATVALAASAASGLPVSYSVGGPASLSGSTLTLDGVGTVTVTASQAGDNDWSAAPSVSLTLDSLARDVSFSPSPTDFTYDGQTHGPGANPSPSDAAYVAAGTASATDAGEYQVRFDGAGAYSGTSGWTDWRIDPMPVTFSLSQTAFTYNGGNQGPAVVASSPGATFSEGGTVSASEAGTYVLAASANGNYAGSNALAWTIAPAPQSIVFPDPGDRVVGATVALAASATSGLPVSYSVSGPASLSGGTLELDGVGTVTVTASQAGDNDRSAAPSVSLTFNSLARGVSFSPSPTDFMYDGQTHGPGANPSPADATYSAAGTAFAVNAGNYGVDYDGTGAYSGTSGWVGWRIDPRPVTFSLSQTAFTYNGGNQGPRVAPSAAGATFSEGGVPTATEPGAYALTVSANGNYSGAATLSWTINPAPAPTATLSASPAAGTVPFDATLAWSTSNAGSAVVSGPGVGSSALSGSQAVVLTAPGTYTYSLVAGGLGGQVSRTATVTADVPRCTLTTVAVGDGSVTSGGTYPVGTTLAVAATPGAGAYFSQWSGSFGGTANPLSLTLVGDATVYADFVSRAAQTISFLLPAAAKFPGPAIPLAATASSGLPVSFAVLSGAASVAGDRLTLTGTGPVVVQATQGGDARWLPAAPVGRTLNVQPAARIARVRANAAGRDARTTTGRAGGGSGFLWTDPQGLQGSPWPSFADPKAAPVTTGATPLQGAPPAESGIR